MPVATTIDGDDGVRIVQLTGAIDVFNAGAVQRDAIAGLSGSAQEVVLDLEAVSFLDSAGISAIVKLVRQLRSQSISARAHIGGDSALSPTIVELLKQVVPLDDGTSD